LVFNGGGSGYANNGVEFTDIDTIFALDAFRYVQCVWLVFLSGYGKRGAYFNATSTTRAFIWVDCVIEKFSANRRWAVFIDNMGVIF